MRWNLRLAAANRGIWKASERQRLLADRGLVVSAGKMSGLWSRRPASIKLESGLAEAFGLGTAREPLVEAASGWGGHNTVFRLVTDKGAWAIKRLGRSPVTNADAKLAIELAAYASGVPMPRPVPTRAEGHSWAQVEARLFRCHEWVEGDAKQNEDTSAEEARTMGGIVAHLHRLAIPWDVRLIGSPVVIDREGWQTLADAGRARSTSWANSIADGLDALAALASAVRPIDAGSGELVGSHGDLNAHNVLFSAGGLHPVDWDAAGPAWPRWERAHYALLWAERQGDRYEPEAVSAFLRGYLDGGGTIEPDDPNVLCAAGAAIVPWVVQNVRMAIDHPSGEQDLLAGYLVDALLAMPRTIAIRQAVLANCLASL